MENKFCRICWNTANWQKPTGDAKDTGESHVATHGFGFEEWLFNFDWTIDGYKYGFLQPIYKYFDSYTGDNCAIALYTLTPTGRCRLVGEIYDVRILTKDESKNAFQEYKKNGWLKLMHRSIKDISKKSKKNSEFLNYNRLESSKPEAVLNVRFCSDSVKLFDPFRYVSGRHKINRKPKRYHPYDWTNSVNPKFRLSRDRLDRENPLYPYSEEPRKRAAQKATEYSPRHVIIQNRLYDYLRREFGNDNVKREENHVDLKVVRSYGVDFIEIKTDKTARRCIRSALGQLLDYSHYPNDNRASRLLVVGEPRPTGDDKTYISRLRSEYNLEIYYTRFVPDTGELADEI